MTDDPEQPPVAGSPEAAMNEVLAAEQAAAEIISACEQQARASLYEAAQRARQIAERTNERIAIIHQRTRQYLKVCTQSAESTAASAVAQSRDREDRRMAVVSVAAEELAAQLTGSNSRNNKTPAG
jgi:vacuolar-type H+-ATPase subunit H